MAFPKINKDKPIYPPLTMTVADKDGMRVEWTEAGQKILEEIFKAVSPFSLFELQDGLFFSQERYTR